MMDLTRFVEAQDGCLEAVRRELRAGRKVTHWMWFVFPQIAGLGQSAMSRHFAISGPEEARAYLRDAVLGPRLREAVALACGSGEADPVALFGSIDAQKFQASMTLFAVLAEDPSPFRGALERFYGGVRHRRTLDLLGGEGGGP